jgi:hypothetical protein
MFPDASPWFFALYLVSVIWLAYKIGETSGPRGIFFFLAAVFAYQVLIYGPSSLLEGGCQRYSIHAESC